jgi:hypothetical protein
VVVVLILYVSVALIAEVAPRLQYAVPPIDLLKHKRDATPWDPPFPDGAEVALWGMFERTRRVVAGESTGLPDMKNMTQAWLRLQYESAVYVKLPGGPREVYTLTKV